MTTSDYNRFRCARCDLVFVVDLQPDEVKHCPNCAATGSLVVDNTIALCSNCGDLLYKPNRVFCAACGMPMCGDCHRERRGRCRDCGSPEADLVDMPAASSRPS